MKKSIYVSSDSEYIITGYMKKEIVFATNNAHKLEEVSPLLETDYKILSLNEIGCKEEIPETADTLKITGVTGVETSA